MVSSVSDTTSDIVLTTPRNRWWAWAMAGLGLAVLALIGVASLLPSILVCEK